MLASEFIIVLLQYIVLLFIIIILEIVAGVLGFVFRNELATVVEERATDAISRYRLEEDTEFEEDVNEIVDFLQTRVSLLDIL